MQLLQSRSPVTSMVDESLLSVEAPPGSSPGSDLILGLRSLQENQIGMRSILFFFSLYKQVLKGFFPLSGSFSIFTVPILIAPGPVRGF